MTWNAWRSETENGVTQLFPVGDIRPHDLHHSGDLVCWCSPDVEYNVEKFDLGMGKARGTRITAIVSHNALDGREKHELGAPLH